MKQLRHIGFKRNAALPEGFFENFPLVESVKIFTVITPEILSLTRLHTLKILPPCEMKYSLILTDLTNLTHVSCSGRFPKFALPPSVTYLNVSSASRISSEIFSNLTNLTSLKFTSDDSVSIQHLSGLTQLTSLKMPNFLLETGRAISGLTNLTRLEIPDGSLRSEILKKMPNLKFLSCRNLSAAKKKITPYLDIQGPQNLFGDWVVDDDSDFNSSDDSSGSSSASSEEESVSVDWGDADVYNMFDSDNSDDEIEMF